MTPETQQILIYVGIGLAALFTLFMVGSVIAFIGLRLSKRHFGSAGVALAAAPLSKCSGNCGCNCAPPPQPGCIPALECSPPYAHPIAIHGLSCDSSNQQFAYAGDIQAQVDAMNRQREIERQAASIQRLAATVQWMQGGQGTAAASPTASKASKSP